MSDPFPSPPPPPHPSVPPPPPYPPAPPGYPPAPPGYPPAPPGYPPAPPGYPSAHPTPGAPPPPYSTPIPGSWAPSAPTPTLAGFGARLGAHVLDGLLYGLAIVPFGIGGLVAIGAAVRNCDTRERRNGATEIDCQPGQLDRGLLAAGIVVLVVGVLVMAWVYLRALARTGQTWGRKIAGVRVVSADDGGPPGWGKAIGRTLFKATISAWPLWLGYLWMLWDDRKQTWHDKVASTLVVRS